MGFFDNWSEKADIILASVPGGDTQMETAIENLNDDYPGFQTFYNTMRGDLSLANALETVMGNNIDVDGRNRDGTEAESGGLAGYDRVDAQLSALTSENPQVLSQLNEVLAVDGSKEFLQTLAADATLMPRLAELANVSEADSSPATLVETLHNATLGPNGDSEFFEKTQGVMEANGASALLDTLANDPGKMNIVRGFSAGDSTSLPGLVNELDALLEEDPDAFEKLNTVLNAPGAEDAFEALQNSPEAMQNMGQMLGFDLGEMSTAGMIDALYDRVVASENQGFFNTVTEAYADYAVISAVDGFDGLSQTLQQNPEIMTHMADILGVDVSDMDNTEALTGVSEQLERLVDYDAKQLETEPGDTILQKMDEVLQAEGAEEFLATVAGNEALSNIVGGMAGGEMGDPESVRDLISGLHERISRNPDYMVEATDVLQRSQGLIATFGEHAAGRIQGSDDALALMDQAIQTNNLFTGLQDGSLLSGIGDMFSSVLGPEYSGMISDFLAGIQEFLGPLFERIGGMLGGIMDADVVVADDTPSLLDSLEPRTTPTAFDSDGEAIAYEVGGTLSQAERDNFEDIAAARGQDVRVDVDRDNDGVKDNSITFTP